MKIDPVKRYAQDVTRGRVKASRLAVLACRRHLRDVRRAKRLKIRWDMDAALAPIEFIESFCVLAEGDHANRPFLLRPWQKFVVGCLFGWKLMDGSRRFRRGYIEIAKGNGKTPLAAAIGLYMLVADNEQSAECYAAAVTKDQAGICYRDAKIMAEKSAELAGMLDIGEHNIAHHASYSFFRPVSAEAKSLDGKRVHYALVDEIHAHTTALVVNKMVAGRKGRRQPLVLETTNSGFNKRTVCGEHHDYGVEILQEIKRDESWFVFICGLDPCKKHLAEGDQEPHEGCRKCDQWTDEKVWIKANPNLNQSVGLRYLRDQVRTALGIPSEQNEVKRLNFCIWTAQATRWLPMDAWNRCVGKVDFEVLKSRRCFVGIDLANKIDIAAAVLLFPPDRVPIALVSKDPKSTEKPISISERGAAAARYLDEGQALVEPRIDVEKLEDDYIAVPYFWMPKDDLIDRARKDGAPYDLWVRQGLIEATEGNVINFGYIRNKIIALNEVYNFRAIGYDPYSATETATILLNDYRMPMVSVRQGAVTMSEPTKELLRLVMAKRIRFVSNPVFTWMANNVVVTKDSKGNVQPDKERAKQKIDGIVALIIALCVSIINPDFRSVYEERGVRAV